MQIKVPNASNKMILHLGKPASTKAIGKKIEGWRMTESVFFLDEHWSPPNEDTRKWPGWEVVACHDDGKNFICSQPDDGRLCRLSEILTVF